MKVFSLIYFELLAKLIVMLRGIEVFLIHRKLMFIASHETPLRWGLETNEVATSHCAPKVEFFSFIFRSKGAIFLMEG